MGKRFRQAATPQQIELVQVLLSDEEEDVRKQAAEILPKLHAAAKEVRIAK